jgi:hypothetical protein
MQVNDQEARAASRRVQELCRQLAHLVLLSREQRRTIDRLIAELNTVARLAERRLCANGAGGDPTSSSR